MDGLGKLAGVFQIGGGRLTPDQVCIRCVCQTTRDRLVNAGAGAEKTLNGALTGQEGAIILVDVAGDQVGSIGIGASQQHGGRAHHVCGQTRGA